MQPLRISDIKLTAFNVPFVRPYSFAGQAITGREGYYLELTAGAHTAQGEIAPLPGMSRESLKKAAHDLKEAKIFLTGMEVPATKDSLIQALRGHKGLAACCPSVKFGIESALFGLAGRAGGVSLRAFLGGAEHHEGSAVLLQGTFDQIGAEARIQAAAGARVFKLKVGDRNIALDVKKVQELREIIGPAGRIRLDANGAWSFSEAVLFAQLAGPGRIEFIEEPLADMGQVNEFYQATRLPVALDETLQVMRCGVSAPGRCSPPMASSDAVAAYIIKPMILGGIINALDWIEEARHLGKNAVISSAFETPVGMAVLETLATQTPTPPGLDTQKWFA